MEPVNTLCVVSCLILNDLQPFIVEEGKADCAFITPITPAELFQESGPCFLDSGPEESCQAHSSVCSLLLIPRVPAGTAGANSDPDALFPKRRLFPALGVLADLTHG